MASYIMKGQVMNKMKLSKKGSNILVRVGICVMVLFIGWFGMVNLAAMKKAPAGVMHGERVLEVDVLKARVTDVDVFLSGFGDAKAFRTVSIAPEVSGKVTYVNPSLDPGKIIRKGEVLFKIDPLNYRANLSAARADVGQKENAIAGLKEDNRIDKKRVEILKRSRNLAKAEFARTRNLFEKSRVGTKSSVDGAERDYNLASDNHDQMEQRLSLHPIRMAEAKNFLQAARAKLKKAKADLDRCIVYAPFNCRVKAVSIEACEYAAPGVNVLTIADDSFVEIMVPLESNDVNKWMMFKDNNNESGAWFSGIEGVDCSVSWSGDKKGHTWKGKLDRVVEYDPKTRTITVSVLVSAKDARGQKTRSLPLVEGMFCKIKIPGLTLENVIKLPRSAVGFENTVFVAVKNRLKTVPVRIARMEGDSAFVESGISSGDDVVITRLVDPLENSLVEMNVVSEGRE